MQTRHKTDQLAAAAATAMATRAALPTQCELGALPSLLSPPKPPPSTAMAAMCDAGGFDGGAFEEEDGKVRARVKALPPVRESRGESGLVGDSFQAFPKRKM